MNYQSVWTFLHNVIWSMDMIQLHNPLVSSKYSNKFMLNFILIAFIKLVGVMVSYSYLVLTGMLEYYQSIQLKKICIRYSSECSMHPWYCLRVCKHPFFVPWAGFKVLKSRLPMWLVILAFIPRENSSFH